MRITREMGCGGYAVVPFGAAISNAELALVFLY
jgi:hypothetical protein